MSGAKPDQESTRAVRDWIPDSKLSLALNLGGIVLSIVALLAFAELYAATHDGEASFELAGRELLIASLITLLLVFASMAIHEWIHALAIQRAGGTPTYGAKLVSRVMPVLYCTAEGHLFTRTQFIVIALAPMIVLSIIFVALIAFVPYGAWLVVPAALHTGGCVGDLAMTWKVLRAEPGTLVEDRIAGLRLYLPA